MNQQITHLKLQCIDWKLLGKVLCNCLYCDLMKGGWQRTLRKRPTSHLCKVGVTRSLSSAQPLSRVRLFATPWIAALQASLFITNSRSPPKPMSIKSVMPSSHLILCHPLLLLPLIPPSIRVFQMSQLFASGGQSIRASASASVLPMNTQDWSPSGWTG